MYVAGTRKCRSAPPMAARVGRTETFTAAAEELTGTVRAELWPRLVARFPTVGAHQAKTTRQFPVIVLTRQAVVTRTS